MRAWVTTDSHFGKKQGNLSNSMYSKEWFDIMVDYYENLFIPTVLENKKEGDILIHCGDVFDQREYLEIKVMCYVKELFKKFTEIFPEIYIIAGNHDIYYKDRNEVNALISLEGIGLNIFTQEHHIINDDDMRIALVPWRTSAKQERETLDDIKSSDYYFGHTSVVGALYSGSRKVEHGNKPSDFNKFGKVYTGHIHTSQVVDNVRFLGSPYQLTRNDRGNKKSFWCIDFQTGEEKQYVNDRSPKFTKLEMDVVSDLDDDVLSKYVSNNFFDLAIDTDSGDVSSELYESIMKRLSEMGAKKIKRVPIKKSKENKENQIELIEDEEVRDSINNSKIDNQVKMYLDTQGKYKDNVKEKVVSFITKIAKKEGVYED